MWGTLNIITQMDAVGAHASTTPSPTHVKHLLDSLSQLQWNQLRSDLAITASTRVEFVDCLTEAEAAGHLASITSWVAGQDIRQWLCKSHHGSDHAQEGATDSPFVNILEALLCHDPVRVNMFEYLSTNDACLLRAVSSNCRQVVATHGWHDFDSVVKNIQRWRACFPLATACNFGGTLIHKDDIVVLSGVTWLDIGCVAVNDEMLDGIPSLRTLRMEETKVTDAGLSRQSELRELGAAWCDAITNHGIRPLTHLVKLDVRWCSRVSADVFSCLPALRELACTDITDSNIHLLPASLVRLELSACVGLTDAGLAALPCLRGLQHLRVWRCRSLEGSWLSKMTALQSLNVPDCPFVLVIAAFRLFFDSADGIINICSDLGEESDYYDDDYTYDNHIFCELLADILLKYADNIKVTDAMYGFMGRIAYLCASTQLVQYLLLILEKRIRSLQDVSAVHSCLASFLRREYLFSTIATLPLLFQAMHACLDNSQVCFAALQTLSTLHTSNATLVEAELDAARSASVGRASSASDRGVPLIMAALRTHMSDKGVVSNACQVISCLHNSHPLLDEIVECHGVSLVCTALREHTRPSAALLRCVGHLATHATVHSQLIAQGAIPSVARALQSPCIVLEGGVAAACDTLAILACNESHHAVVTECGGIQSLVEVLRLSSKSFKESSDVISVCHVICALASTESNAIEFVEAGLLPLLHSKLVTQAGDLTVVRAIHACISQLSRSSSKEKVHQ